MKYRTVIEIVSEAESRNEAVDIAGEFLRGNLEDGIKMRCFSGPIRNNTFLKASILFIFIALLASGISVVKNLNHRIISLGSFESVSTVQPPLKTNEGLNFKENWRDEENKKILDYIRK